MRAIIEYWRVFLAEATFFSSPPDVRNLKAAMSMKTTTIARSMPKIQFRAELMSVIKADIPPVEMLVSGGADITDGVCAKTDAARKSGTVIINEMII